MSQLTVETYDSMSKGSVDPSKWRLLSLPSGNGQMWTYEEPKVKIAGKDGGLSITVDPFTRKHDSIHMFDDPKHMYSSTQNLPLSSSGTTVFMADMAAETFRSDPMDFGDAFAAFNVMDLTTGMIFDFITTGQKIGVIYERLLIPGLTDENTAFTHVIESPFTGVKTSPGRLHHYEVRLNASQKRAEFVVDGKRFFRVESLPVQLGPITLGFGLFTLKPVDPVKGSTSIHGQGASGVWKNVRFENR